MIFVLFLIVTVLVEAAYLLLAPAVTVWSALGVALQGYLAAQLLYVLILVLNWLFLPRLKPDEGIERQRPLCRWAVVSVCQFLCGYAGIRLRTSGLEKLPDTPFLLVSNHRSMFDPLIVIGLLARYNVAFVSKPSNLKLSLIGQTARHAGILGIDRENDRAALKTILQAADYLKRGVCNIGIYPEGTRNRSDEPLLPFHAGSFKIAQRAGVPVAVVCMQGTEKVPKKLFFYPTPVKLSVLEVIPAETVKSMKTVALAEHTRELLEQKLREEKA